MKQDKQNTWQKRQTQKQKIFLRIMAVLLVLSLIVVIAVPVSYVPLFRSIYEKFGLSNDVARKLTLVDLALSSLGVETKNMQEAFKQTEISNAPSTFLASRYEMQDKRLLDAREIYYNEFEYTHKRPNEIAGIYQDGRKTDTPKLSGEVTGLRATPQDDYLSDKDSSGELSDRNSFSNFGRGGTAGTSGAAGSAGGSGGSGSTQEQGNTYKARKSYDRDEETAKKQATDAINKAVPDFANNIYSKPTKPYSDEQAKSDVMDLNNSRMIKPVVKGQGFDVSKKGSQVESFLSENSITYMFGVPTAFGGHNALGYYISDDLPKTQGRLQDYYYFGSTGLETFGAYFYTYAAVSRRYKESAKFLSELAFNGADADQKILIAPGQSEDKVVRAASDLPPLEIIASMKGYQETCSQGKSTYDQETSQLRREYEQWKEQILYWSYNGGDDGLDTLGAPGSCDEFLGLFRKTVKFRRQWNDTIDKMLSNCSKIWQAQQKYASSCGMALDRDNPNGDSCKSLNDLKVLGGGPILQINGGFVYFCKEIIKWNRTNDSPTFDGCNGINDCKTKITKLFESIDSNVMMETQDNFLF